MLLAGAPGFADKLRKVNQDLSEINADMKATERTLTQMEKCCGCCTCPCCATRNFESQGGYKDTWGEKAKEGEVGVPDSSSTFSELCCAPTFDLESNHDRRLARTAS